MDRLYVQLKVNLHPGRTVKDGIFWWLLGHQGTVPIFIIQYLKLIGMLHIDTYPTWFYLEYE